MDLLPRHINASVSVIEGVDKGKTIPLQYVRTIFGRKNGDVILFDTKISGSHFCIEYINGTFFLVDMGSTNGTYLNRQKITEAALRNSDEIQIGFSVIIFQCNEHRDMERIMDIGRSMQSPPGQAALEHPPLGREYYNEPSGTVKMQTPFGAPPQLSQHAHGTPPASDPGAFPNPRTQPGGFPGKFPEAPVDRHPQFSQAQEAYAETVRAGGPLEAPVAAQSSGQSLDAGYTQRTNPSFPMRINQPLDRPIALPKVDLYLEILRGNDAGKRVKIQEISLVLGRVNADMNLRDNDVSRKHAVIEIYGREQVVIRDLASTNGTFVNGKRIHQATLQHNDNIRLGKTLLQFTIEEEAVSA